MESNKVGLVLGTVMGLWHLAWGILVALGLAQALLDWIYWLHFLNSPFVVQPFDPMRTLMLVVVTFIVGYLVGWVFSMVWNQMKKSK